jgi:hypothetical protein
MRKTRKLGQKDDRSVFQPDVPAALLFSIQQPGREVAERTDLRKCNGANGEDIGGERNQNPVNPVDPVDKTAVIF